jgi:FtsH-binding integral membrane protein
MSDFNRGFARPFSRPTDMSVDAGLRAFMLGVYNKVALGLVLSGALAWLTSHQPVVSYLFRVVQTPYGQQIGYTPIGMALAFAPLVILLGSSFFMRTATPQNSGILYWTIVALLGASLGVDVLRFTGESVATTFFVSVLGVLIFAGLIAWDTQRLKATYYHVGGDSAAMGVATNYGALSLYLDFINLFQFLLMFMGNRR